jgi:hypothetical protein
MSCQSNRETGKQTKGDIFISLSSSLPANNNMPFLIDEAWFYENISMSGANKKCFYFKMQIFANAYIFKFQRH